MQNTDELKQQVRQSYGAIAQKATPGGCCGGGTMTRTGGCAASRPSTNQTGDLGLGCGNPTALASLRPGEVVLDLGSGAGGDCFRAADLVGPSGWVIGVDMTPEMVALARLNLEKLDLDNVEFRQGDIENLPAQDSSVDVILSNCVVNLASDKRRVWTEAFRVLKPGGRISVADIVASEHLPADMSSNLNLISACVGGATLKDEVEVMLREAGFEDIRVEMNEASRADINQWFPGQDIGRYVVSAMIEARKPQPEAGESPNSEGFALEEQDAKEVRKKVYRLYENGFHCAEVILQAALESVGSETPPELRRVASVFGGGIVATGELCGAFTGGVVAAGHLLGRDHPGMALTDLATVVKEFKVRFTEEFESLSCPSLLEGFANGKQPLDCVRLTARASVLLVAILGRQGMGVDTAFKAPGLENRGEVPLGSCPFGGCAG